MRNHPYARPEKRAEKVQPSLEPWHNTISNELGSEVCRKEQSKGDAPDRINLYDMQGQQVLYDNRSVRELDGGRWSRRDATLTPKLVDVSESVRCGDVRSPSRRRMPEAEGLYFITAEKGGVARAKGVREKEKECTTECKCNKNQRRLDEIDDSELTLGPGIPVIPLQGHSGK